MSPNLVVKGDQGFTKVFKEGKTSKKDPDADAEMGLPNPPSQREVSGRTTRAVPRNRRARLRKDLLMPKLPRLRMTSPTVESQLANRQG